MCYALDSEPPIPHAAIPAAASERLVLGSADGSHFMAFHARPRTPDGTAIVILPDVRGLHHFYEELALRFAEIGVEALAIDYFGRTAGTEPRDEGFDHQAHVAQMTWAGTSADIRAAAAFLRAQGPRGAAAPGAASTATASTGPAAAGSLYTIGFCMGGRLSFLSATLGLGAEGVIGFYGFPAGPSRNDTPAPLDLIDRFSGRVLGIFGGADQAIPVESVYAFRDALSGRGIANEIVVEPDAPHSFFDRKSAEFAAQSDDAWSRVRRFVEAHGAA